MVDPTKTSCRHFLATTFSCQMGASNKGFFAPCILPSSVLTNKVFQGLVSAIVSGPVFGLRQIILASVQNNPVGLC